MPYDHTTYAYDRMVSNIEQRLGAEDFLGAAEDVARYGADTGWGGFTYTSDCVEFYEEHKDVIWGMLQEDAEDMGYDNPMQLIGNFGRSEMGNTDDGFKNLLAWYALEVACRRLLEEAEAG